MINRRFAADPPPNDVDQYRARLFGLAYRMLGDVDEAEDVVQEAFLRWHLADQKAIRSPEAWLVTVVTRLSVDRLRRLATERESYPGPWLPEPIATEDVAAPSRIPDTDRRAEIASELSVALLLILERLAPEERAAFLLREVFEVDYAEIARILERSPDAVRQMVHRARTRVHSERTRVPVDPREHERILETFVEALTAGDAEGVLSLLAPDVALATDGGGRAQAARNWLSGRDRVTRFLLGVRRKFAADYTHRKAHLNGVPAILTFDHGSVISAMMVDTDGEKIRAVHVVRNPDKLRRVLDPKAVPLGSSTDAAR
jgi:RNA polymerase sigma-70 factor, ECF subfamily